MDKYILWHLVPVVVLLYNTIVISLQLIFDSYIFSSYRQLVLFDLLSCVLSLLCLPAVDKRGKKRQAFLYVIFVQFLFVLIEVTVFVKGQLIFKLVYIYWLKLGFLFFIPLIVMLILKS